MKDQRTRPRFRLVSMLLVGAAVLLGLAGTAIAIDRVDIGSSLEGY